MLSFSFCFTSSSRASKDDIDMIMNNKDAVVSI